MFQTGAVDLPATQKNVSDQKKTTNANDPDTAAIKSLIEQLGSPEFTVRDTAIKRLEAIGKPALPALRDAARNNEDAEIRRRAQQLVERISPVTEPLEERFKEAVQAEAKKDYKKAAGLFDKLIVDAKKHLAPGTLAPSIDIPFLTEVFIHSARVSKQLGEYEKAARDYRQASYYSNYNNEKRRMIAKELSTMATELLASWKASVEKRIENKPVLKALTAKYPLVLLHTRRYAGDGYLHSAYSFSYATTEQAKHFNDVQLLFDNQIGKNSLDVNCLVDQENQVADLGKVDVGKDPVPANIGTDGKTGWSSEGCEAEEGHVYLEHIKDSRGNDFYVVFQVVATDKDSRFIAFLWRQLPGGTVVRRQ
jgi:hypothetical protein